MSMIEYLPLTPELARRLATAVEPGLILPFGAELWADAAKRAPDLNFAGRATFGMRQGEIIGAGGVIPDLKPRAVAWFIIEPLLPSRMLVEARRKCAEVIARAHAQGWRRIEDTAVQSELDALSARYQGEGGRALEAAADVLAKARDPQKMVLARQLFGELNAPPEKITLPDADRRVVEKQAESAYFGGVGQLSRRHPLHPDHPPHRPAAEEPRPDAVGGLARRGAGGGQAASLPGGGDPALQGRLDLGP